MVKLKVTKLDSYKGDEKFAYTYRVEAGYKKYFLFLDNCDVNNAIIYFAVLMFNDIKIDLDCDHAFWKDFIDLYAQKTGERKKIYFTGRDIPFLENKRYSAMLLSGGMDSMVSWKLIEEDKKVNAVLSFKAQAYPYKLPFEPKSFSTNIDDILFHSLPQHLFEKHKLEIMFPIITRYQHVYMGIESEIWRGSAGLLDIDLHAWVHLFENHGVNLSSPVKDWRTITILEYAIKHGIPFTKCGHDVFCLSCEKCLTLYIEGANWDAHSFPRTEYERKNKIGVKHKTLWDLIKYNWGDVKRKNVLGKGNQTFYSKENRLSHFKKLLEDNNVSI